MRTRKILFVLLIVVTLYQITNIIIMKGEIKIKESQPLQPQTVEVIVKQEPEKPKMPTYDIRLEKELQTYLWELCQEYKLSYEMVLALIQLESEFDRNKVNRNSNGTRDVGIVQVNSKYQDYHAKTLNVHNFDPYDPKKSIELGVKLLNHNREYWRAKDMPDEIVFHAHLTSYNRGIAATEKLYKTTGRVDTTYSRRILELKMNLEMYGKF